MPDITLEDRIAGLRGWVCGHDACERAAVELLIWHETWLRRPDFTEACITQLAPKLVASIDWYKAQKYLAARPHGASSSQVKILDLAIALATREYPWLTGMGTAHARAIVTAVATALGVEEER